MNKFWFWVSKHQNNWVLKKLWMFHGCAIFKKLLESERKNIILIDNLEDAEFLKGVEEYYRELRKSLWSFRK